MPHKDPRDRRANARAYYNKHRARVLAKQRAEYVPRPPRTPKPKYKRNPEKERAHHLKKRFGITEDQYLRMWTSQNGVCVICRQPETFSRNGKVWRLSIDHDHATGKIRELLCMKCNIAIGNLKEDPMRARAVADYLEKHRP